MKNCIILALSLFLSCQETTQPEYSQCFSMTFSDAQPVQFWLADCATYNEKEVCGVYASCFCQPFQCDDEIKVQFQDDSNDTFILQVLDDSENILFQDYFTQINDIQSYSLTPSETSPDLCDTKIQLRIAIEPTIQEWEFPVSMQGWQNESAGSAWAWNSAYSGSVKTTITGDRSQRLFIDGLSLTPNTNYRVYFNFYIDSEGEGLNIAVRARDSLSNTLVSTTIIENLASGGYYEGYLEISSVLAEDVYRIEVQGFDDNMGVTPSLYLLNVTIVNTDSYTVVAKSDCLDIKSEHDCSKLITYSNHRNFAGLNFETSSPDESFYLRVPCVFFHERFPEEDEVMKLTSQIVTLNGTLEAQRLMETDYMPYYMHRKLKLVLKMTSVEIDGQNWVKSEAYEIQEGNKRFPRKMAKVYLNEADYVQRNVL